MGQNLHFWHENSRISSDFGAKIQIFLKLKFCQNPVLGKVKKSKKYLRKKHFVGKTIEKSKIEDLLYRKSRFFAQKFNFEAQKLDC